MITQAELKKLLNYDYDTGIFYWNNLYKNKKAGCLNKSNGYLYIGIKGKHYPAHRLAWLYAFGVDASNELDHINGIKTDNSILNLRIANRSQNAMNRKKHTNNTSGMKGVCWDKSTNSWKTRVYVNKKVINLGRFDDLEFAGFVAQEARRKYQAEFFKE